MDLTKVLGLLDTAETSLNSLRSEVLPETPPPAETTTIVVKAGDDLQKALAQASIDKSGKPVVVRLAPKATFMGGALPNNSHGQRITVRPDFDDENLGGGKRIDPANSDLPKIAPRLTSGATLTGSGGGVRAYRFMGLNILPTGSSYAQIALGDANTTDPATTPDDIAFDRCVIHGDAVKGQKRGILANCRRVTVMGCDMRHHGFVGQDAQCIVGWNGPGPFTIVGNLLEGYGENIMFGGGTVRSDAMVPSNILIGGNWIRKNKQLWDALAADGKWAVKNLLELKNARDVEIAGNLIENVWTHGQTGTAVLFKAAANAESVPLARCHRVRLHHNIVRHAGSFLRINNSEGGTTLGSDDIEIAHNIGYDFGTSVWTGDGSAIGLGGGPDNVRLLHNTLLHKAQFLKFWENASLHYCPGMQVVGNIAQEGAYGIVGQGYTGGLPALTAYAPGVQWDANVIEDDVTRSVKWPTGTTLLGVGGLATALKSDFTTSLTQRDRAGILVGADVASIRSMFAVYGLTF